MREILFRGKRADNGEWVYGYYSPANVPVMGCLGHFINEGGYKAIEIDPETIGQFTGLTDKNGTKIFEGDIISIKFELDAYDGCENYSWYESAQVVFSDKKLAWFAVFEESGDEMYLNEYIDEQNKLIDAVVIGNIHDNP